MASADDHEVLQTPEEIDLEIARLEAARDELKRVRDDPEQRAARIKCRQQDAGRWRGGLPLTDSNVSAIKSTQGNHPDIWQSDLMLADGCTQSKDGKWLLSPPDAPDAGAEVRKAQPSGQAPVAGR